MKGQNNLKMSEGDTINVKTNNTDTIKVHSPKKATLYSTLLPGLGQIYNKKYWKLPIVYGGFGGLGYMIVNANKSYQSFRSEYLFRIRNEGTGLTNNPEYDNLSTENLRTLLDNERRSRDLFIAGSLLLYVLNIVDATVDAHLFDFNVTDDLSIHWQPNTFIAQNQRIAPGIGLRIVFK